jgi:hypothetical protein
METNGKIQRKKNSPKTDFIVIVSTGYPFKFHGTQILRIYIILIVVIE